MLAHAEPEMLTRHVPKILSGEELWAQFFSETEAGSDLAGVRTRAELRDGAWVINGGKMWSSGGVLLRLRYGSRPNGLDRVQT